MKKILKIGLALAALLLLMIAAAPTLLSTTTAREFCLSEINKRIPGKISLSNLETGWTSGLLLQDLEIKDPAGRVVLSCEKIELADSIFTLLVSPKTFGHLTVLKPACTLFHEKEGDFSLLHTFGAKSSQELKQEQGSTPLIPYFSEASIQEGSLRIVQDTTVEGSIQDFTLELHLQGLQKADFSLSASITQNGKTGQIAISGNATDLLALKKSYIGLLQPSLEQVAASETNVTCSSTHFPVAIADTLLSIAKPDCKGLLQDLLGETFDATITHRLHQSESTFNTAITSPTVSTKIDLLVKAGKLHLPSPAELRFTLVPDAFEKLKRENAFLSAYALAAPTAFEAVMLPTTIQLPLAETPGAQIELRFGTKSPLQLVKKEMGTLQVNLTGSVDTASLADQIASKIRITAGEHSAVGMVEVDALIKTPFSRDATAKVALDLHGAWPALLDRVQLTSALESFIGKEIHAHTRFEIPKLYSKTFGVSFASEITSQAVTASTTGSLKGTALKLGSTKFAYDLMPAQLQKFTKITLGKPLKAVFSLSHLNADCTKVDLQNLDFKGSLTLDPFELSNVPQLGNVQSKKTLITFEQAPKGNIHLLQEMTLALPSLQQDIAIKGSTTLAKNELEGKLGIDNIAPNGIDNVFSLQLPYTLNYKSNELQVEATLSDATKKLLDSLVTVSGLVQGTLPQIASKGTFQELPTKLITLLAPSQADTMTGLLGHEVAGSWEVLFAGLKKPQNLIRATIKSPEFTAGVNLRMDENAIQGASGDAPLFLKMMITNERAKALMTSSKLDHLSLKNSTPFECTLKKFTLPLSALDPGNSPIALLDRLNFEAAFRIGALELASSRSKTAHTLPPINGKAELAAGSREVTLLIENEKNEFATEIHLQALLKNLWDDKALTLDKSDIRATSKLKNLPVDFIQLFTSPSTREKIAALAGDSIDASLDAKLTELSTGSLQASLDAERIHSNATCSIHEGVLTLPKPLTIKAIVTKDAGKTLFQDVNPLLATSISTPHPVEVTIDNRDFRIPLKPYLQTGDINQLKRAIFIPSVTVQIGKIRVQKGNTLSTVFSLLGLPDEAESELWLTPIYLQMQNGLITMRRSDTLVDGRLQIASWGTVDLIGNRVDMVIGIPGSSLKTALHLRTIDPNYMLQLPIRGTTSTASLDKTRAVAKIASLRMRESSSDTQALIGGVLGLVTQASEPQEAPVPAPTTVPFPWQK